VICFTEKLYFVNFWTLFGLGLLISKKDWTVVGLGLNFENSRLDLDFYDPD